MEKEKIIERARMVLSVLAQVPMIEDAKAREAGNIVYEYCRAACCKTDE